MRQAFTLVAFAAVLIFCNVNQVSAINAACTGFFGKSVAYPGDCSKYIVCVNSGYTMNCSPGLHFNFKYQNCDWPGSAGCQEGSTTQAVTTQPPPTAPPTIQTTKATTLAAVTTTTQGPVAEKPKIGCPNSAMYSHPTNCAKYYSCNGSTAIEHTCPTGYHFNPILQECDYPVTVGCDPLYGAW